MQESIKVNLNIPYIGSVEGTWEPDESERSAAWEMYVELITRISVAELKPDTGLLREALSSLYSLFHTFREILRKYGPSTAKDKGKDKVTFGFISLAIMNGGIRPVLARWHPLLLDYENTKLSSNSQLEHERKWEKSAELRKVINGLRSLLIQYAELLAQAADVRPLIIPEK